MSLIASVARLLSRFRYPVSLPEDVAKDLGLPLSNNVTFNEFLDYLSSLHCRPTRLHRYMPREEAEALFSSALKKENFKSNTLFSYYFNHGWLVFALYYDRQNRLKRLSLQCPSTAKISSCDLYLQEQLVKLPSPEKNFTVC